MSEQEICTAEEKYTHDTPAPCICADMDAKLVMKRYSGLSDRLPPPQVCSRKSRSKTVKFSSSSKSEICDDFRDTELDTWSRVFLWTVNSPSVESELNLKLPAPKVWYGAKQKAEGLAGSMKPAELTSTTNQKALELNLACGSIPQQAFV